MTRKPQAFVLDSGKDEPKLKTASPRTRIAFEPEPAEQELAVVPAASAERPPPQHGLGCLARLGPHGPRQPVGGPRHHPAR
jgi:hypothetical protein